MSFIDFLNEAEGALNMQKLEQGKEYLYEKGKWKSPSPKKFLGFSIVGDSDGKELSNAEFKGKVFKNWKEVEQFFGTKKPAEMMAKGFEMIKDTDPQNYKNKDFGIMAIFDGIFAKGAPGPVAGVTIAKASPHSGGKSIKFFEA